MLLRKPKRRLIVFAAAISLGTKAFPSNLTNPGHPMKVVADNRLVEIFKATKTVCIGRFLLDVPMESDLIYGPARLPFLVERWENQGEKLDEAVKSQLAKIEANDRHRARGPLTKQGSMFGSVINGAAKDQRIVFGADAGEGSFYSIYSIQRVGRDLHVFRTMAYGDAYRESVIRINAVAPRLRPRLDNELPADPGICLDGAFLEEPATPITEAVSLGVRLRQYPDVHFSLEMIKKDQIIEDDSLEARIAAAEEGAKVAGISDWYSRAKVFRRGPRIINGWVGYEYLARKPTLGKVIESHEFGFFSHGELNNPMLPTLDIALDTGVKGNMTSRMPPSITNEEALYLWDRITASIRPRPITKTGAK